MSATIVISSSPPLFWARDPTPVTMLPPGSQSNSRSPDTYCSPKRFKTTPAIRDSFSHGFSSARALLVKPGVENLPLRSTPPKDRFKTTLPSPKRRSPPFIDNRSRSDVQLSESVTRSLVNDPLPEEAVQEAAAQHTPCRLERAVSRKMDWTPVADDQETEDASDSDLFARGESARAGLMNSFGFKSTGLSSNIIPNVAIKQSAVKRRKLDLVDVAGPIIQKAEKRKGRTVAPKKSKASVKKAKTITDLVTSHHKGKLANESMLADYLVASQARMVDGPASDDNIDVATTSKRRRTATKAGKGKKSKLLSPTSAIKTVEQQQTMFGSLSQLARDEPVVEADLSSDPVSPLRTQPISIESTTPRLERGTSRFVRTRNLWGAAERDENNALVFTENLDLVHSPVTDVPLTGQNVVVHSGPTLSAVRLDRSGAVAMCSKFPIASPSRAYHTFAVLDVDDLSSPADGNATVTESNHFAGGDAAAGASGSGRPLGTSRGTAGDSSHDVMPGDRPSGMTLPSVPKPRYAGMHTDDLKKAIQDYGFKPIRSRQKMIEKLEECWDQKEARRVAKVTQPDATQTVAMKQSDIISDVHALSARPVPKSKTPKVKAAGAKAPASPKEPKKRKRAAAATTDGIEVTNPALSATKEPRKRKSTVCDATAQSDADETVSKGKARQKPTPKKSNKDEPQKPKKPRGRPKAASVPQAAILDVDDIDDDFTNLTMIREEKEKQKARLKAIESEMLTPPATLHISESKAFVPAASESADAGLAPEPGIGRQIQAAILYQSKEAAGEQGRDHIRDPSWHEKILMYDPIVLEDLARWLNAEGLAKVREDREVTTLDVRSWCESKGICCLWKGGWRGQGTKNGSD